jgi:excisionase family DNA binding protein
VKSSIFWDRIKIRLEDLITQKEAARIRGVSPQSINELVKKGKLKTVTVGGRRFLLKPDVEAYQPGPYGRPRKRSGKSR